MRKSLLLWIGFAVCVVSGLFLSGLPLKVLLQPTAAIIVLLPVILFLLYSYGTGTGQFLKRLMQRDIGDEDCRIIDTACALGFLFGIIGMVIGFVMVMSNLSETSKLGAGIAASIISIFYGALPSITLLPLRAPSPSGSGSTGAVRNAAGFMMIAFFMMTTDLFVVLYALR